MERDFLSLNRDVINGNADGKVIWQPRIYCWMEDKLFLGEDLPGKYKGLDKVGLYKELDCSNRCYEYNGSIKNVEDPSIKRYSRKIDELRVEQVIETPVGKINTINRANTSNPGVFQEKWCVETEDDLKVMLYVQENTNYIWNQEHYDAMMEKWGNLGLPCLYTPRVTMQHLMYDIMGVEPAIYSLYDFPDTVNAYMKVLNANHLRYLGVAKNSCLEWVNYGDNIHAGVLSPRLFKEYVLPAYQQRADLLKDSNIFTFAHWDGDCKAILPYAKETDLSGIEAITPEPQGDVTLKDMKDALGDDMFLIDGIAALLFMKNYPLEDLITQTKELIDLFAPKLILGISDEMPSEGLIQRVELVRDIVDEYNCLL